MNRVKIAMALCSFLILASCATLVQKTGEVLEGSAFAEKTVSLYRSAGKPKAEVREVLLANGEQEWVILTDAYPGLRLVGRSGADGGFFFTRAEVLATHVHGWNEFTLELAGAFTFTENNGRWILGMPVSAERLLISSGKIRYKDTRVSGGDALGSLRNRRERLLAVTEWLSSRPVLNPLTKVNRERLSQEQFDAEWKPLLFPELVSNTKRPLEYDTEHAQWIRGNGVAWNGAYTQSVFPEELWELRNQGALLRDWEESLSWMYLEYSWDSVAALFDGMEFTRTK